jgi:hypothetical protein
MTASQRYGSRLASVSMACNVTQALERAVRARAGAEGLTMPEAQRAALQAWAAAPPATGALPSRDEDLR